MDNVATHIQRLQLGPHGSWSRRRARQADPHACMRRLLAPTFRSGDDATFLRQNERSGCATPVFHVAFAHAHQQSLLASVDEDGVVALIDTNKPTPTENQRVGVYQRAHHSWQAHENAIFDVAWAHDNAFLLTAAGDLRATAWDVETRNALFSLAGAHTMSVKCVRLSVDSANIVATGARDGNVLLWDARTPSKPVAQLLGVHSAPTLVPSPPSCRPSSTMFVSPSGARKRRRISALTTTVAAVTGSRRSVTSVEFLAGGNELATAGAADGVVKFWDLRRLTAQRKIQLSSSINSASVPVRTISCASRVGVQRGITSMALDPTRSRLLVSVLNDELCVVDVNARDMEAALLRLDGHIASSFYVKSTFSPDGDFVVSGSGDGAVYMWDARTTHSAASHGVRTPTLALKGHTGEVNSVAWHASDFTKLASCSDDGTIRVWTADRANENESFALQRNGRHWQNWGEFERQEDGRAYRVKLELEQEQETVKNPREMLSPPVIRRNRDALAVPRSESTTAPARTQMSTFPPTPTPPRRSAPQQTLLDFWGR